MRDAYKIIGQRYLKDMDQDLKVEEFTLEELEDALSQGCKDRNHMYYMQVIAKRIYKLRREKE